MSRTGQRNQEAPRPKALDTLPDNDQLTVKLTEFEFLWQWLSHASAGNDVAMELASHIQPDSFTDEFYRQTYEFFSEKVARGETINDAVSDRQWLHIAKQLNRMEEWERVARMRYHEPENPEDLKRHGRALLALQRGRFQYDMCLGAASLTLEAMGGHSELTVKQIADDLMDRLMRLHSRLAENPGPVTQAEIAEYLISRVNTDKTPGIDWPWQCMQQGLGTIAPGDVVGLSAYSGNGKTMFVANLFLALIVFGIPVIVFPTEMGLRFLERVVAIAARVPKRFAEKGDWRQATPEQMERYRRAMRDLVGLRWDVVKDGNLSPIDIIARVKVLRRKYRGLHVLAIVDHAHRLQYPKGVKADDALGAAEATRMFKNHATSDTDGGLSYLVLYQPSQPENEALKYRPVGMYKIRGHSGSTTELDVHMSCFRRLVRCDTTGHNKTPWGTPSALWESPTDPLPAPGTYDDRGGGTKVDDQHFYMTSDKDRVNGEVLNTMMLNCHAPSGFIYEGDWLAGVDQQASEELDTDD